MYQGVFHFYKSCGSFPVRVSILEPFNGMSNELVMLLTEASWWLHIVES
jgi:hypothetical protein